MTYKTTQVKNCSYWFNCCSCGDNQCGCSYCYDCNACEQCKNDNEKECENLNLND